jgi:D-tagatose-1,6-bisphosphate aldolase subunit GatZ/KbaZ
MIDLDQIIHEIIARNIRGEQPITLLAACPNSEAVLEAAVRAASRNRSVMLFAATLNQVDFEDSYTGWTPAEFVELMRADAKKYQWTGPLYPCLDHGGPWLKDEHTLRKLSYPETMQKVKHSITDCVRAGYQLLHIDPTVDRTFPPGDALPVEIVVDRTVELIEHAEQVRTEIGREKLSFEVGTEEVHGGLTDTTRFENFIILLRERLSERQLSHCWPCLFVAQIGTDLHTTQFNPDLSRRLNTILSPYGSMIKGHYTDWVENPAQYPVNAIGAANVGPEFTAVEFDALKTLSSKEAALLKIHGGRSSKIMENLQEVVVASGRWKKWLLPGEVGVEFNQLPDQRRVWLLQTGSRYIWRNEKVISSRKILYQNLSNYSLNAHDFVVDKIARTVEKYLQAFNLVGSSDIFG